MLFMNFYDKMGKEVKGRINNEATIMYDTVISDITRDGTFSASPSNISKTINIIMELMEKYQVDYKTLMDKAYSYAASILVNEIEISLKNPNYVLDDKTIPRIIKYTEYYILKMKYDSGDNNSTSGGILNNLDHVNERVIQFHKLTEDMVELYSRKNRDYGDSYNKSLDEDGLLVAKIRMFDKLSRFSTLIRDGYEASVDESLRDTLVDLANYSIMTVMWYDKHLEESVSSPGVMFFKDGEEYAHVPDDL